MEQLENEIWKPTYVNPDYLISNKGRIKTLDRPIWNEHNKSYNIKKGRVLKPTNKNTKKYWRIGIPAETGNKKSRKMYSIHRLVATAFIPNPQNLPQINHIDGNKDNNCVENLEWCDNRYNIQHSIKTGLRTFEKNSVNCNLRKLSEEQVSFIKYMYPQINTSKPGEKTRFYKTITEMFGLKSENTIYWITSGGTNKFFNQDIVQTPKYNEMIADYNKLWESNAPRKTKADWARELGVIYSSFNSRFRMFKGDLNATINYFRQLKGIQ